MPSLLQLTQPTHIQRLLCSQYTRGFQNFTSAPISKGSVPAKLFLRPLTTTRLLQMPSSAGGHPHPPDGAHNMPEEEREAWKHRVPYRVHDNDENFVTKWRGSCHCGKTKYQLSRDRPLVAKYCHCTTCQRLHGEWSQSRFEAKRYRDLAHCGRLDRDSNQLTLVTGSPFQWAAIFHKEGSTPSLLL